MPAKGTTTGNKQNWLRTIAIGLNVIGHEATNSELEYWLNSIDGRKAWDKELGGFANKLPHPGTLRNYFTEARASTTDDDRPWSIGQTVSGKAGDLISPDALPFVLHIWLRALVGGRTLSVRQARWCARLLRFYTMGDSADPMSDDSWIQMIYAIASLYAAREQQAEKNQLQSGAQTGDLDAILAFGMANLSGDAAASGSEQGLDIAIKLGLVSKLNSSASDSARIDDEPTRVVREWIVEAMDSELEKTADSPVEAVKSQTSDAPANRDPSRIPYWGSVYISLGVRVLTRSNDWASLSGSKQRERAIKLGTAIHNQDWTIYDTLASQAELPEYDVSDGVSDE